MPLFLYVIIVILGQNLAAKNIVLSVRNINSNALFLNENKVD